MAVVSAGRKSASPSPLFEIKSNQLPSVVLMLKTGDLDAVALALCSLYGPAGESAGFFDQEPLVLDFSQIPPGGTVQSLHALNMALRQCGLIAVAAQAGDNVWQQAGREEGLPVVAALADRRQFTSAIAPVNEEESQVAQKSPCDGPGQSAMVVERPLRSGQKVYARGADLIMLAMVNPGAEVAADGNIHVYAPLRGKAMAGARGDTKARIYALSMEPELVSIAGVYRTSEKQLPHNIQGKPAQVRLSADGHEKLLFEPLT